MITYYCCTQENNNCEKRDNCIRFINSINEPSATLFKYACTEENNYLLYMEKETNIIDVSNNIENKNKEND